MSGSKDRAGPARSLIPGGDASPPPGDPHPETPPETLPEAALWWSERGYPVFPLQDGGKRPRSAREVAAVGELSLSGASATARKPAGGFRQATREPEIIRRWWSRWPEANIGCAVPPRRVILDLDTSDAAELLAGLGLPLPPTATVRTARGRHLHYGLPEGCRLQQIDLARALQARRWGRGEGAIPPDARKIELRAAGKGYAILPPSVHPSGAVYTLDGGAWFGLSPAPAWLVELFGEPSQANGHRTNSTPINDQGTNGHRGAPPPGSHHPGGTLGESIPAGERDETLFRYAGHLAAQGLALREAEALLRLRWQDAEQPSGDFFPWDAAREKLARALEWRASASRTTKKRNSGGETPISVKSGKSVSKDDDLISTTTETVFREEDFPELAPLNSTAGLPGFPVEALPPAIRGYVVEVGESVQTPVDLPAFLALGVLAAAGAHSRLWLQVGPLKAQPVGLYLAPVLAPSERKSSAFQLMVEPLQAFEADLVTRHRKARARAEELRHAEEAHVRRLRKQAGEAADAEARQALADQAADASGNVPDLPPRPCLLASDATQEGLAQRLKEQGGRLAVFDTEGALFSVALGRYSSGTPSFEVLLRAWSADPLRIDRKGSEPVQVEAPVLTVCVPLQPDVLRKLGETPETVSLGLVSRFLFALPPSLVGTRLFRNRPLSEAARSAYSAAVGALLTLPTPPLAGPKITPWRNLRLDGEALELWAAFYDRTETAMAPGGRLATFPDWGGKLAANVARIAALFHAVSHAGGKRAPWEVPFAPETVAAAVAIGEYLRPHARTAYESLGADPVTALALRAWDHITRRRWATFSARDLYRHLGKTPQEAEPALEALEERGYIRRLPPPPRAKGQRGRAPAPRYQVRPGLVP